MSLSHVPFGKNEEVKEITVSVEGDDGPLLVIPVLVKLDADTINPGYFDVRIQVETDENTCVKPTVKVPGKLEKTSDVFKTETRSNDSKPYTCGTCKKSFATRQHLDRHSNLHSKQTLYPCSKCDKVMLDKSYLSRHLRTHSGDRPFSCNTCHKRFLTASSLRRHMSVHNQMLRPYVCSECGKRFPDNSSFKKHIHLHSGVRTHVCLVCAKGFAHVGDLNLHMKSHNPVKEFCCDVCGKEFSRHNNLTRHKRVHSGEGSFKCDSCNVSYQHAGTLTRHILTCHPGKAKLKKTAYWHLDSVKNEDEESSSCEILKDGSVENYYYMNCGQTISTDNTASQHVESVTASKPSFEIYKLDAAGNLRRVDDPLSSDNFGSLQIMCDQSTAETQKFNSSGGG